MNNIKKVTLGILVFAAPHVAYAAPLADSTAGSGAVTMGCVNGGRAEAFEKALQARIKSQLATNTNLENIRVKVKWVEKKLSRTELQKKSKDLTSDIAITIDPDATQKISLSAPPAFSTMFEECVRSNSNKYRVTISYKDKSSSSSSAVAIRETIEVALPAAYL